MKTPKHVSTSAIVYFTILFSEPTPDVFSPRPSPREDVIRNVVTTSGVAVSVGAVLRRGEQPFKYFQLATPVGDVGLHMPPRLRCAMQT